MRDFGSLSKFGRLIRIGILFLVSSWAAAWIWRAMNANEAQAPRSNLISSSQRVDHLQRMTETANVSVSSAAEVVKLRRRPILSPSSASSLQGWGWQGVLKGPDGKPIHRGVVEARLGQRHWHTRSDARGWFQLEIPSSEVEEWVKSKGSWQGWLRAYCPGLLFEVWQEPPLPSLAWVDFELKEGLTLQVDLVDLPGGRPLAGVGVVYEALNDSRVAVGISGVDGVAKLAAPAPGPGTLVIPPTAAYRGRTEKIQVLASGQRNQIALSPWPAPPRWHCFDRRSGQQILNVEVRSRPPANLGMASLEALATRSELLASHARHKKFPLYEFQADGYLPRTLVCLQKSDEGEMAEFALAMEPAGETEIRLLVGGEVLKESVEIQWSYFIPVHYMYEDQEPTLMERRYFRAKEQQGKRRFSDGGSCWLPIPHDSKSLLRSFRLTVQSDSGRFRDFGNQSLKELGPPPWTFDLEPQQNGLSFQVRDASGFPLPDVVVALSANRSFDLPRLRGQQRRPWEEQATSLTGRSGVGGRVDFFLPPGSSWHWLAARGKVRQTGKVDVPIRLGDSLEVPVIWPQGQEVKQDWAISGNILGWDQIPRLDQQNRSGIVATPADGQGEDRIGSIRPDGSFSIQNLGRGDYLVDLWAWQAWPRYRFTAGEDRAYLELPPGTDLQVEVVSDQTGESVPGATVRLLSAPPAPRKLLLEQNLWDKRCQFSKLAPREHWIHVGAPGYGEQCRLWTPPVGAVSDLQSFRLQPGRLVEIRIQNEFGLPLDSAGKLIVEGVPQGLSFAFHPTETIGLWQWSGAATESFAVRWQGLGAADPKGRLMVPAGLESLSLALPVEPSFENLVPRQKSLDQD
ncbi:MAG: hypothetical protein DWQ01_01535 [Planctomycetota bacterium]|nr:MAG: hypothetical protein DWQ01_01535 [Planctomycetota bacterium]